MSIITLLFEGKEFIEEKKMKLPGNETGFLKINTETREAILTLKSEITLIDKTVAKRLANSICRSGFLLDSGERIGIGSILSITM